MKTESTPFEQAVERNLRGVFFFSPGACTGCDECGITSRPCGDCEGNGFNYEDDGAQEVRCSTCEGTGTIEPTEHERDIATEPHFSWSSCDSCGSHLGGDRHPAHGIIAETHEAAQSDTREITHFDICTDCVCYHANGDLPEDWRG